MRSFAVRLERLEAEAATPDGLPPLHVIVRELGEAEGWLAERGLSAAQALAAGLECPTRYVRLAHLAEAQA